MMLQKNKLIYFSALTIVFIGGALLYWQSQSTDESPAVGNQNQQNANQVFNFDGTQYYLEVEYNAENNQRLVMYNRADGTRKILGSVQYIDRYRDFTWNEDSTILCFITEDQELHTTHFSYLNPTGPDPFAITEIPYSDPFSVIDNETDLIRLMGTTLTLKDQESIYQLDFSSGTGELILLHPVLQSGEEVIAYMPSSAASLLAFPQVKLRITLPNTYHAVTQADVDDYNDPAGTQQILNACRSFSIWSGDQFGLNISYDTYTPLCGTERGGSSITEPQFQVKFQEFCEELSSNTNYVYGGCTVFRDPPEGFRGYSYYQFIYDYGEENTGTIIREVFLENINEPSRKIIFGYIPATQKRVLIYDQEFQQYISRIYAEEFEAFKANSIDVETFEAIVQSLETY